LSVTHEADQELLSAYLDGELTAEEQARVEQLLSENQVYRQLYDELRALRTNFDGLPRHRLQQDLSGQVLRLAEQAMLRESGLRESGLKGSTAQAVPLPQLNSGKSAHDQRAQVEPGHGAGSPRDAAPDHGESELLRLRFPRGWRPWLWPAIALAAAWLVMVFNPQNQPPRKLAQAPSNPPDIAISAAGRMAEPNHNPANLNPDHSDSKNDLSDRFAADTAEKKETQPQAPAVEKQSALNRQEDQAANAAPVSGVPGAGFAAKTVAPPAGGALTKGSGEPGGAAGDRSQGVGAARGGVLNAGVLNEAGGVLVVDCIIRPEAVRSGTFDKLLAKNQIIFERARQVASQPDDARRNVDAVRQDAVPAKPGWAAPAQIAGQQISGKAAPNFGNATPAHLAVVPVYVEASRQQIQAMLAEMHQDREDFIAMRVQPGANTQAPLLAFNRFQQKDEAVKEAQKKEAVAENDKASPPAGAAAAQSPQPAGAPQTTAANSTQPPLNSTQSPPESADAKRAPTMRLSLGVARSKAPSAEPSRQLSADPLMASQAAGMAGGNQAIPQGVVNMESRPVIVTANSAVESQRTLRVLFLLYVAEAEAATTAAPPTPAAASPIPKE
jgi:hypothetical protein